MFTAVLYLLIDLNKGIYDITEINRIIIRIVSSRAKVHQDFFIPKPPNGEHDVRF